MNGKTFSYNNIQPNNTQPNDVIPATIPSYRWVNRATVAIDFEATGINAHRDRILQYGLCGVDHNNKPFEVVAVVDAQTTTGRDPFLIPGVSKSEVRNAKPISEHLDLLYSVCHDAIVICHKREFDWTMLQAEFRRHHRTPPIPFCVECTLRLARSRIRLKGPHTLGALCDRLDIPLDMAHNALHDARATFRLYILFLNKYPRYFQQNCWKICSTYWAPYPWVRHLEYHRIRTPSSLAVFEHKN